MSNDPPSLSMCRSSSRGSVPYGNNTGVSCTEDETEEISRCTGFDQQSHPKC